MMEELLKGLTEEQIAKVKACKTQEELLAVAKEEGVKLTDEQLGAISGGACMPTVVPCPSCSSNETTLLSAMYNVFATCQCKRCGHKWTKDPS